MKAAANKFDKLHFMMLTGGIYLHSVVTQQARNIPSERKQNLPSACPVRTRDKIAAHEGHGQLIWKAVFTIPDREALTVKVFPEVRDSHSQCVLVRVLSLELVQHK